MWVCVLTDIIMSAIMLIFMDKILLLAGASSDTCEYTETYLTIIVMSGPFVLISNCYSNVIRAEGQSVRAIMGQLLSNLLNVLLDPIMILLLGWNAAGASVATVIGNVLEPVITYTSLSAESPHSACGWGRLYSLCWATVLGPVSVTVSKMSFASL